MNVLVIVSPERPDFYYYLKSDPSLRFSLLWYERRIKTRQPNTFFSEEFFWEDYATPQALIKEIKPDKIVFFEIIDQRQIALLVAANAMEITTFYLEHGAAADKATALARSAVDAAFIKQRVRRITSRLLSSSIAVVRTKYFYLAALPFVSFSSKRKYRNLLWQMLNAKPNTVLRNNIFPERIPRFAITFNAINFDEYQLYTGASIDSGVFTGLPMFDKYAMNTPDRNNDIVYIEHPYLEENLLNWNVGHHERIAKALEQLAVTTKTKILIKLHPRSKRQLWDSYKLNTEYIEIVQAGDYTSRFLAAKLILGYSSSLITGLLCAKRNIVLLGWHPEPQIFGADFSKTGLCHKSLNLIDLHLKLSEWIAHNMAEDNPERYHEFIHRFNYPFDGNATERVINAIKTL